MATAALAAVNLHGAAIPSAGAVTAAARWTLPDGSTVNQSVVTNRMGKALLSVPASQPGRYSVTIDGVSANGLTFDSDAGVTTGSIIVT